MLIVTVSFESTTQGVFTASVRCSQNDLPCADGYLHESTNYNMDTLWRSQIRHAPHPNTKKEPVSCHTKSPNDCPVMPTQSLARLLSHKRGVVHGCQLIWRDELTCTATTLIVKMDVDRVREVASEVFGVFLRQGISGND